VNQSIAINAPKRETKNPKRGQERPILKKAFLNEICHRTRTFFSRNGLSSKVSTEGGLFDPSLPGIQSHVSDLEAKLAKSESRSVRNKDNATQVLKDKGGLGL